MKRILIYDIEIMNCIPSKNEIPDPNLTYCGGWKDFSGMGIASIAAMSCEVQGWGISSIPEPNVFMPDNLEAFPELLAKHDILLGFNNLSFDDKLLQANSIHIPIPSLDLLVEIWCAAGLGPNFVPRTHGGYGLDATCEANGLGNKSGNGAQAPILYQQKRYGSLLNYNLHDAYLTTQLFNLALERACLVCPKTKNDLYLRDGFLSIFVAD